MPQFEQTYQLLEKQVEKRFNMIVKRIRENDVILINTTKVIHLKDDKDAHLFGCVFSVAPNGTILFNMNKGKTRTLNYDNIVTLEDKIHLVNAMNLII